MIIDDKVRQVIDMLSCDANVAKLVLERNNWDVSQAISSYFENPG